MLVRQHVRSERFNNNMIQILNNWANRLEVVKDMYEFNLEFGHLFHPQHDSVYDKSLVFDQSDYGLSDNHSSDESYISNVPTLQVRQVRESSQEIPRVGLESSSTAVVTNEIQTLSTPSNDKDSEKVNVNPVVSDVGSKSIVDVPIVNSTSTKISEKTNEEVRR